jgi:DNA-binding transcriptional LysR family regulator
MGLSWRNNHEGFCAGKGNQMDLKQLEYFLAIAEEEQLTAAAKRLYMSQPPLSYQLKNLETELGVELFERCSRKMKLTPAGHMLKAKASQILEMAKCTVKELEDYSIGINGTLRMGIVSSLCSVALEKLQQFHQKFPLVNFAVSEGSTDNLVGKLLEDVVEIALIRIPLNAHKLEHLVCDLDSFEHYISSEEDMVAVMHRSYDHFPEKDVISMADLNGKPLIFCRRFQSLITSTCFNHGYEAHVICLCDDTRNSVEWAEKGLGVTLAHSNVLDWGGHPDLVIKTIDEPVLRTKQVYLWRKDRYISAIARNFLEIIQGPAPERTIGENASNALGDARSSVQQHAMGGSASDTFEDIRDPAPERTAGENASDTFANIRNSTTGNDSEFCVKIV